MEPIAVNYPLPALRGRRQLTGQWARGPGRVKLFYRYDALRPIAAIDRGHSLGWRHHVRSDWSQADIYCDFKEFGLESLGLEERVT